MTENTGDMHSLFHLQSLLKETRGEYQKILEDRMRTKRIHDAFFCVSGSIEEGLTSVVLGREYTYKFCLYYPSGANNDYQRRVKNLTELEAAVLEDLEYARNINDKLKDICLNESDERTDP